MFVKVIGEIIPTGNIDTEEFTPLQLDGLTTFISLKHAEVIKIFTR